MAYAKASNLETGRIEAVMKVAAVPFFPGVVAWGGSGLRVPIYAKVLQDDTELRASLAPQPDHVQTPRKLSLEVQRVETYVDFRRRHLVNEPDEERLGDLNSRLQQAAREALDASVGKDGLIVFLGGKAGVSTGVLIRFDKGIAKVAGVLGNTNPELGPFGVLRPAAEKGK